VECLDNASCSGDDFRSRCLAEACAPCRVGQDDCAAIEGKTACAAISGVNRCVECASNADCSVDLGGPACKLTAVGNPNLPTNTCVECVVDADCTSPGASNCVQNQCQPCAVDADCSAQAGRAICDLAGGADGGTPECVECTGPKATACGTNVCNSLLRTCTDAPIGDAGLCEACLSDAHCAGTNRRCVAHSLSGGGFFCFLINTTTCTSAPFTVLTTGTIDNASQAACVLRRASCQAFLDFDITSCNEDSDCGLGNGDGVCSDAGPRGDICSLPCMGASDCAGGSCFDGACLIDE
jgi:hypothetical protein